jgi:SAM-dependent methyltransferase
MDQLVLPPVLDACCGSRMMWFDRKDPRALFIDKRQATYAKDRGTEATKGRSPIVVAPDIMADFTDMPFADGSFRLVVFDPPHVRDVAETSITFGCFGSLPNDWEALLRDGFRECFRVLCDDGVLVFKWAENDIPIMDVLELAPIRPLFGHRSGKFTHWCVFIKRAA